MNNLALPTYFADGELQGIGRSWLGEIFLIKNEPGTNPQQMMLGTGTIYKIVL